MSDRLLRAAAEAAAETERQRQSRKNMESREHAQFLRVKAEREELVLAGIQAAGLLSLAGKQPEMHVTAPEEFSTNRHDYNRKQLDVMGWSLDRPGGRENKERGYRIGRLLASNGTLYKVSYALTDWERPFTQYVSDGQQVEVSGSSADRFDMLPDINDHEQELIELGHYWETIRMRQYDDDEILRYDHGMMLGLAGLLRSKQVEIPEYPTAPVKL